MHLKHIQSCRVCNSKALTPVINLGLQHLQGSFVKLGMEMPPNRRIPCEIVRCDPTRDENACGLLQMKHSVPPSILYSNYWYVSGTNQTMRDHLNGIADEAIAMTDVGSNANVAALDIGCNDCTLLMNYPAHWDCHGIDPSNTDPIKCPGNIKIVKDLFPSYKISEHYDVITSIAMFYDLEDPVGFAMAINEHLSENGTWIFEMSYMPTMLAMNSYDTICHEHLEYYSLTVLERIMKLACLKIFRAELNDINGGSIRCYATHVGNNFNSPELWTKELVRLRESEFDMALDTDKPYASFQSRIENHRDKLMGILHRLKDQGKSIHLLGASTKGNTLLQWCGIDSRLIDCASDRNPKKNQAMTLGTCIQIVSEEESRSRKPDYYLVLPWHFRKELLERERSVDGKHPGFIFPLPDVEVIEPICDPIAHT
jgi:hypothetical protein